MERFEIEESKKERQHIEISEGKGQPLGEIESSIFFSFEWFFYLFILNFFFQKTVRVQIDKRKGEDELLKKFYTILFHKPGKVSFCS